MQFPALGPWLLQILETLLNNGLPQTILYLLEVSDDWEIGVISKWDDLLVNHKSEDSHHGSTAIVQLDGTLLELGLLIEVIPAEVNVSVTEVTNELISSSGDIAHEGALEDSDEGNDLDKSSSGNGVGAEKGGNAVGEGVEGISGVVDGSREVDSGTGHDLSEEGKHADTSMLDLDVTKTVEALLGAVTREHSEGVEESERGLGAKLVLEGTELGGGLAGLGRGEGGGRSHKGGEGGKLHHVGNCSSSKLCDMSRFGLLSYILVCIVVVGC